MSLQVVVGLASLTSSLGLVQAAFASQVSAVATAVIYILIGTPALVDVCYELAAFNINIHVRFFSLSGLSIAPRVTPFPGEKAFVQSNNSVRHPCVRPGAHDRGRLWNGRVGMRCGGSSAPPPLFLCPLHRATPYGTCAGANPSLAMASTHSSMSSDLHSPSCQIRCASLTFAPVVLAFHAGRPPCPLGYCPQGGAACDAEQGRLAGSQLCSWGRLRYRARWQSDHRERGRDGAPSVWGPTQKERKLLSRASPRPSSAPTTRPFRFQSTARLFTVRRS